MKRKEQFDWAVSVLVKAYFDDTLRHGDCTACAVGNLIAAANGYKFERGAIGEIKWEGFHQMVSRSWHNILIERKDNLPTGKATGKRQIASTGYNVEEVRLIENAFEDIQEGENEHDQYPGLMRVVDALIEIHEGSEEEKQEAKAMFVK